MTPGSVWTGLLLVSLFADSIMFLESIARVAKSADAKDLKVRSGQQLFRANLKPCGRGGIGRRIGLKRKNLSARRETNGAELLKVGEPFSMAIPSQARLKLAGKV